MKTIIIFLILSFSALPALAEIRLDSDNDGVPDKDEIEIYHTDPNQADTDGDGYNDWKITIPTEMACPIEWN